MSEVRQNIDCAAPGKVFNRYFQNCIGSCHAYLTLREDFRQHLRTVQSAIGFKSLRCHGIFHDLVGIYHDHGDGLHYNFQNLNKIYDFLLEQGLRPYVELSFMPRALRSDASTVFVYEGNISPPSDMTQWNQLIKAFVTHLVDRYGIEEVREWYFEVWNEPDLKGLFWSGSREQYFELYRNTATTIKAIDSQLKVGGPSTSRNHWIAETLEFCSDQSLPIDFISTHHYCADVALEMGIDTQDLSYQGQKIMAEDVRNTVKQVRESAFPELEVHYSEWNVSPCHEDRYGKDSEFTAVFVLQTLMDVDGLADTYSFWCISDIFEESGPGLMPYSGKYGLLNINGIKKPVFHAWHFLSQLYDCELPGGKSTRVSRSEKGDLRLLSWHFVDPIEVDFNGGDYLLPPQSRQETLVLENIHGCYRIQAYRIDAKAGNSYRHWQAMGSPQYPDREQIAQLHQSAEPVMFIDREQQCHGSLEIAHELSPCAIVFYDIQFLER